MTITPRERVLGAICHSKIDRVPLGFDAGSHLTQALFAHFHVSDLESLYDALGIDGFSVFTTSYVFPRYIGPEPPVLSDGAQGDFWGKIPQRQEPLAFAEEIADLGRYRWPSADWFDYTAIKERCLAIKHRGRVTVGGEGGCGIAHTIDMRGYESTLLDLLERPALAHAYLDCMADFMVEWNERWLAAAGGEFDIFRCGDDMGNNVAMHCSPALWREFFKPRLARVWEPAKKHGLKIWFHSCGCVRPVLEDLIELGIDMWDPVPGYVKGNDQKELKALYGSVLTFVGGVDEPNILRQGTPAQVRDEVKRAIDTLAPGGGYILAGSQVLTDDVPVANVLAMYEAALEYGSY